MQIFFHDVSHGESHLDSSPDAPAILYARPLNPIDKVTRIINAHSREGLGTRLDLIPTYPFI